MSELIPSTVLYHAGFPQATGSQDGDLCFRHVPGPSDGTEMNTKPFQEGELNRPGLPQRNLTGMDEQDLFFQSSMS